MLQLLARLAVPGQVAMRVARRAPLPRCITRLGPIADVACAYAGARAAVWPNMPVFRMQQPLAGLWRVPSENPDARSFTGPRARQNALDALNSTGPSPSGQRVFCSRRRHGPRMRETAAATRPAPMAATGFIDYASSAAPKFPDAGSGTVTRADAFPVAVHSVASGGRIRDGV